MPGRINGCHQHSCHHQYSSLSSIPTGFSYRPAKTGHHAHPVETRLLNLRTVRNMTKNGKLLRFSAMVAAGNGNGGVGVGQATHESAQDAIAKAGRLAIRNIEYFERWKDHTLFHDDFVKFKATKLYVRPAPPMTSDALETGRRCHPAIAEMCRCMGIADISAKVHGSSHPMNVAKAFLLALGRQKTPEQVSRDSGMRIVDVLKVYEQGCENATKERY